MSLLEDFNLQPYKRPQFESYVKSPFNYIGGKYRLLSQIVPLFPKNIDTFVDLFCGGCNVAFNVSANNTVCNDINAKIIEIFQYLLSHSIKETLQHIYDRIDEYQLSKTNEYGFNKFREYYNQNPHPLDLYVLICYSYNYQFRFNNNLQYNSSFGRDRSEFTPNMKRNLTEFVSRASHLNVRFTSFEFQNIDLTYLTPRDFIYLDPPYLITTGNYNDGNRGFKNWTEGQEKILLELLTELSSRGVRFALSNVLYHKGRTNCMLLQWSKDYNIYEIKSSYSSSSFNTKGESREVVITNYGL